MKKQLSFLLCMGILLMFAGCSTCSKTAASQVEKQIQHFQNRQIHQEYTYGNYGTSTCITASCFDQMKEDILNLAAKKLNYKILQEQTIENNADITLQLEAAEMGQALEKLEAQKNAAFAPQGIYRSLQAEDYAPANLDNILQDAIEQSNKVEAVILTVHLKLINGRWVIQQ